MKFITDLEQRLSDFGQKDIFRLGLIYLGFCAAIVVAILGYYIYSLQDMKSKMTLLNKTRKSVQSIFTQYQVVKQQKNRVDETLKQNKNFNIVRYFQDLIQRKNLTNQTTTKLTASKLSNGYLEDKLEVTINQIDMKMVSEILLELQQESIVYVMNIDITKQNFAKKVNLVMTIATIRAEEQAA